MFAFSKMWRFLCLHLSIYSLILVIMSSSAYASYPMRVKDARGKMVTIKSKPMRIVSIAPNNTEILYALGLGDRIVGVTNYCKYPPEAIKKPKIGDMTVNTESLVALKPDLVIAHAFINSSAIPRLEKLGITVLAIDPKTIDAVMRDIRTIGDITARPRTASAIVKKMSSEIESIKTIRAKKPVRTVLVVIQSNPLWVAGPKTFVDEMIHLANAKNVAYDARSGFVTFSKELAITRNPDVIIVGMPTDRSYFLKSPEWRNTNAVRRKKIFVIRSEILVQPGPRLTKGLKEMARTLE